MKKRASEKITKRTRLQKRDCPGEETSEEKDLYALCIERVSHAPRVRLPRLLGLGVKPGQRGCRVVKG